MSYKSKRMKAQFFILAAILLVALFSISFPAHPILSSPAEDLPFISKNLRSEFPSAYNLGLNQSGEQEAMLGFSRFLNEAMLDHSIQFSSVWVYSKNSSSNLNLTAGNFLGRNTTVNFSLGSASLFVLSNASNSTLIPDPGAIFNITIQFESQNFTVEWLKEKSNLYVFFEIRKGNNIVREEFSS